MPIESRFLSEGAGLNTINKFHLNFFSSINFIFELYQTACKTITLSSAIMWIFISLNYTNLITEKAKQNIIAISAEKK